MDENHQDQTESKLITTEDVRWGVNRKSKLWVPKHKKRTGFEGKTLWDWLQLLGVLAIPLILGIATLLFGFQQAHLADLAHQSDQMIAQQQYDAAQQQALDQQRAAILQTYIDNIQDLLLNHNLLKSKSTDEVAILARARTLTAIQGLDPYRKGVLLNFLYEANLIGYYDPGTQKILNSIIGLLNADLNHAYLISADLNGAHLNGARLSSADLSHAYLISADLSYAILSSADLSSADLSGADLFSADLNNANMNGADLSGAVLSFADLSDAQNLTQQQLDQVFKCKGAILPGVLTCHYNQ